VLKHWKNLRHLPRPVWTVCASTLVNRAGSMVLSFLVLYLTRERDFSPERAGFVMFLYGLGAICAAPLAGRLADRIGSVPLMRASLFASGAGLLLYPLARTHAAIFAASFGLAMLTESFRPAAMAFFGEAVPTAQRKSAFAVYRPRDQPRDGDRARGRGPPRHDLLPVALHRGRRDVARGPGSCSRCPASPCRARVACRPPTRRPRRGSALDGRPRRPALSSSSSRACCP
jgi:hypothetical protein